MGSTNLLYIKLTVECIQNVHMLLFIHLFAQENTFTNLSSETRPVSDDIENKLICAGIIIQITKVKRYKGCCTCSKIYQHGPSTKGIQNKRFPHRNMSFPLTKY